MGVPQEPLTPDMVRDGIANWRRKSEEQQEVWVAHARRRAMLTGDTPNGAASYLADYLNRRMKAGQ